MKKKAQYDGEKASRTTATKVVEIRGQGLGLGVLEFRIHTVQSHTLQPSHIEKKKPEGFTVFMTNS